MKFPVVALAALVLLAAAPAAVLAQSPDFSAVDEAARDAVAAGDIPGVVVLVGRGDEVLYHRAFGLRALVPDMEPMTEDTIFDIASLTKPLGTALAVMALVERGKVSLDAPLGRYLREFRKSAFNHVTIRRLLTHSAGLPAAPRNVAVRGGFPRAAKAIAAEKLDYAPGTGFQYSDAGFMLLGEIVRRVSGESLDQFLDRFLFRPLGLADTTFHPTTRMRARVAPTQFSDHRMMRGDVHDPRARLLGGFGGHAGMFSTASDVARICRMLLEGGALQGRRFFQPETVRLMWTRAPDGHGKRTLGWDMLSGYATVMAPYFPSGSVGHTGFTGTSVWLDPPSKTYLILFTNRVHPNGGGSARIRELRARVHAAVGAAMFLPSTLPASMPEAAADGERDLTPADAARIGSPAQVGTGLDVLAEQGFAMLKKRRVGLITNQTGIDARGRRAIDVLAGAPGVRLAAIFSPEHGIEGTAETNVPHARDAATGLPIWSLYGATRRPDASMLSGIDTLVFDIQDVGVRYYTYLTTLMYVLEEAAKRDLAVVVLDRPNPITGRYVEGPLMDADLESFTAPHTIPVRTGMTIGEFARMVAAERRLAVRLTVIAMRGWERARWFDEVGLPWVNPSPNIRSVTQALLYSGIGLVESTNLSVGRGTSTPFEVVGAPWIDAAALAHALQERRLPGVRIEPVQFTPTADKYARVACNGVRFVVTDREAIRPVTVALALAAALRERHRDQWRAEHLQNLLVNRTTMWAFLRGDPLSRLLAWAEVQRASFLNRRASYLIYR